MEQSKSDLFLFIYFVTNVFGGILFLAASIYVVDKSDLYDHKNFEHVFTNLAIACALCAYFGVAGLSGDRLIAVKYPFCYQRAVCNKNLFIYGVSCVMTILAIVLARTFFSIVVYSIPYSICGVATGTLSA